MLFPLPVWHTAARLCALAFFWASFAILRTHFELLLDTLVQLWGCYCDQCSKEVTLWTDDAHILKAIDAYEKGEGPDPFVRISMSMGVTKN
jgi:hypothetical protein